MNSSWINGEGHAGEIPDLARKALRQFGFVTSGIVAGMLGLFFPWLLEHS